MSRNLRLLVPFAALILVGVGCLRRAPAPPTLPASVAPLSAPVVSIPIATTQPYTYVNAKYSFSLTFLPAWGAITQSSESVTPGAKIVESIRLQSKSDSSRYIQIQVVKAEDKNHPTVVDYPQTYIAENSTHAFFYSSSGDCAGMPGCEDKKIFDIAAEVKEIMKTFTLKGK